MFTDPTPSLSDSVRLLTISHVTSSSSRTFLRGPTQTCHESNLGDKTPCHVPVSRSPFEDLSLNQWERSPVSVWDRISEFSKLHKLLLPHLLFFFFLLSLENLIIYPLKSGARIRGACNVESVFFPKKFDQFWTLIFHNLARISDFCSLISVIPGIFPGNNSWIIEQKCWIVAMFCWLVIHSSSAWLLTECRNKSKEHKKVIAFIGQENT